MAVSLFVLRSVTWSYINLQTMVISYFKLYNCLKKQKQQKKKLWL